MCYLIVQGKIICQCRTVKPLEDGGLQNVKIHRQIYCLMKFTFATKLLSKPSKLVIRAWILHVCLSSEWYSKFLHLQILHRSESWKTAGPQRSLKLSSCCGYIWRRKRFKHIAREIDEDEVWDQEHASRPLNQYTQ